MLSVIRDAIPLIVRYTLTDCRPSDLRSLMLINKGFNRVTSELYPEILRHELIIIARNYDLTLSSLTATTVVKTTCDDPNPSISILWGLYGISIMYYRMTTVIETYAYNHEANRRRTRHYMSIQPSIRMHKQPEHCNSVGSSLITFLVKVFPLLSSNCNEPLRLVM